MPEPSLLPLFPPYSLPHLGFRASEGRAACCLGAAVFAGGYGTHAQILLPQKQVSDTLTKPNTHRFATNISSDRATIGTDFRAKRCALTLDEPLQMTSSKDSFYKEFASGQSRVSVVEPRLF